MKKISIEKIITGNESIEDVIKDYLKIKLSIKDSDVKLKELNSFIGDDLFEEYKTLKSTNDSRFNKFMLENPLLSEYIDEYNYNKSIKEELNEFFKERVDLSRLSNGIPCNHEFVKLNNHLLCMNCFLKEEELDYQSEELIDFLISAALHQGMYIDEIDESELGILEEANNNHKALINELLSKKNNMNETDKHNIDETIKTLEDNRTNEYREYLRNQRNKKLSIKK